MSCVGEGVCGCSEPSRPNKRRWGGRPCACVHACRLWVGGSWLLQGWHGMVGGLPCQGLVVAPPAVAPTFSWSGGRAPPAGASVPLACCTMAAASATCFDEPQPCGCARDGGGHAWHVSRVCGGLALGHPPPGGGDCGVLPPPKQSGSLPLPGRVQRPSPGAHHLSLLPLSRRPASGRRERGCRRALCVCPLDLPPASRPARGSVQRQGVPAT